MTTHTHTHVPTRDAGAAHDPSNGQFGSGSNGESGDVVKHQAPKTGKGSPHQDAAEHAHALSKVAEKSNYHVDHQTAAEAHEQAGDLNDKADHIREVATHHKLSGYHGRKARELAPANR